MPRGHADLDNQRVAAVLDEIGDLLELKGENIFRAVTYRAAARAVRDLREPLRDYLAQGRLGEIPKVGPSVAEAIEQLLTTGRSERHEQLAAAVPEGLLSLLTIPGVGPATARAIYDKLHVTSVDALEEAAKAGRLVGIPKVGPKTVENILKSIASLRQRTGRSLIHDARRVADGMAAHLRAAAHIREVHVAGSLRRWKETIGDVDLIVAAADATAVMNAFVAGPGVERVLAHGDTKSSVVVRDGIRVDLLVVPPVSLGAALLYLTGSKEHNVRLRGLALRRKLTLNEYGLFRLGEEKAAPVASRTEEEIYAALGMAWIPPELREDRGEIDAAAAGGLPALVLVGDIRGDLHAHSDWTDGRDSLEAMAAAARAKGYEYLALTDHSVGLGMAQGLSRERIKKRSAEIRALNRRLAPFKVLIGIEVDIRADGRLDYPDEVLGDFDIVTASVHSAFAQARDVMTKRIIGAMEHPLVNAISHPTGRLLERRPAYDVDVEALIDAAARTRTRLEVNGGPGRLDLSDVGVRRAMEKGAPLVINSDAHAVEELDWMEYGVATARRGWATKEAVHNTRSLAEVLGTVRGKG